MIVNNRKPVEILSDTEIEKIREASARILEETGCRINDLETLKIFKENGFEADFGSKTVKFPPGKLNEYLAYAKNSEGYTLYGRNLANKAEFGKGKTNIMSSSGQYMVYDFEIDERREATSKDMAEYIRISNYLENIDIVGSLILPSDIPVNTRGMEQEILLLNNTEKPVSFWITNPREAEYQIEIMKVLRSSQGKLKDYPFCQCFIEAISPLQFTGESLRILRMFAEEGLPIGFGPMAMQGATAPATVAGTIVQENAEILAGIVISQIINPGNPVTYWGIPHCMDLRTANMSFGSPEQSLLAVSLAQVARSYGFCSIGLNEGLSDSNLIDDAQSGFERGISLLNGIYAKADILAHQGICGQDSCGSILQLIIDNEFLSFLKRYFNFFEVSEDTIAEEIIKRVGIGGNFLTEEHTLKHFKKEIYSPGILNRENWDSWARDGRKSTKERAIEKYVELVKSDPVEPISEDHMKEIEDILKMAKENLR
ncbi:MAG: trimethylamine methyltransferase family protein [Actinobacteria bacterium]|nr:trimethylamine methyltransferase family protein [Actinomycetota bacterium]